MSSILPNTAPSTPLIRCEGEKKRMAKVETVDRTFSENREYLGRILRRTSEIAGMNRDQTADALQVNASSISRWWAGSPDEPPQIWRYTAHDELSVAFLVAQAEARQARARQRELDDVMVETNIRVRRRS